MDASTGVLGITWVAAGGSPAGGSIELTCSGVAEVELVLMSTGLHRCHGLANQTTTIGFHRTGANDLCVRTAVAARFLCSALTSGGVSRGLICRCLECPGG